MFGPQFYARTEQQRDTRKAFSEKRAIINNQIREQKFIAACSEKIVLDSNSQREVKKSKKLVEEDNEKLQILEEQLDKLRARL